MNVNALLSVARHIWQSSLCVGMAWLITLLLRNNRASVRYKVWLAASAKFLIPFSTFVTAGTFLGRFRAVAISHPHVPVVVEVVGNLFPAPTAQNPTVVPGSTETHMMAAIFFIWASGALIYIFLWIGRWRDIQRAQRLAKALNWGLGIPVKSLQRNMEPGVFGIFRPVLLLPQGIEERLSPAQFEAIVAHELIHVRRRDNLTAAIHMAVEAVFWFYPLLWWIGRRLAEEREFACDEEVLLLRNDPDAYAEGIINACRYYHESRLPCLTGITGADLRRRIERIVSASRASELNFPKRALVVFIVCMATLGPFVFGLIYVPRIGAQTQTSSSLKPEIDVASIRQNHTGGRPVILFAPGNGRPMATNVTLKYLIKWAYDVEDYQVSGGPKWIDSASFDITAKLVHDVNPNGDPVQRMYFRQMVQPLLADRFKLVLHKTTRQLPVYALTIGKNGTKLSDLGKAENPRDMRMTGGRGLMVGQRIPISILAEALRSVVGQPVEDRTGLTGYYDFKLQWDPLENAPINNSDRGVPELTDRAEASIFTAIQEQLGLRLEARRGPVGVLVIDNAALPSEN
jgi:bla regulator protein BlaR1